MDDPAGHEGILLDAAMKCAALDDIKGIPTAAVIIYSMADDSGEEWIGRGYVGGLSNAVGLMRRAEFALLWNDRDAED